MVSRTRVDFKRVKELADVRIILERTGVEAKREGAEWVAICPFHDDHKPSLRVNATKKLFVCFACKASGNILDYVVRKERVTLKEAARRIADWCGFPLGSN